MEGEDMKVLLCLRCRPLFALLLLPLAGCMGNTGSTSLNSPSSITVFASATNVTPSQPVTLEATVSPELATGTVTFYNGSSVIGTGSISAIGTIAIAEMTTTFSSIGAQTITAKYNGSSFYAASTSPAITVGVYSNQLVSTSTVLQASTTTPQYQTGVTLAATVSPSSATGSVTFYNGSTNLGSVVLNAGTAVFTTTFAAGGTAMMHAVYSGDYYNASSTSNSITLNVSGPLVTSTSLQVSATSTTIGDPVILTAAILPAAATGMVTFYNGSTAIGTANLSAGVATLNTSFASPGTVSLTAEFNANSSYESSTSSAVELFVSGNTPDSIALQAPSSLIIGYNATMEATITPANATGMVNFYDNSTYLGTVPVNAGTATMQNTFMSGGSQSLTAVYSGDTTYEPATSAPAILVVSSPGSTPTGTGFALSENPAYYQDFVTITAVITPSQATGQVSFYDNGVLLGNSVLSSGTAAYSFVVTTLGDNEIKAVYNGDTTYAASTSSAQDLVVLENDNDDSAGASSMPEIRSGTLPR
jgi:hypothetical protein